MFCDAEQHVSAHALTGKSKWMWLMQKVMFDLVLTHVNSYQPLGARLGQSAPRSQLMKVNQVLSHYLKSPLSLSLPPAVSLSSRWDLSQTHVRLCVLVSGLFSCWLQKDLLVVQTQNIRSHVTAQQALFMLNIVPSCVPKQKWAS